MLVAALAGACAAPPPPEVAQPPEPGAAIEDAAPRAFEEADVDVPARPMAPIEPAYPPELRALGVEGDVEARVLVLPDGSVGGAQLVASSDDAFTAAVREALGDARFHPASRRGRPVPSWVTLRLRFRLDE